MVIYREKEEMETLSLQIFQQRHVVAPFPFLPIAVSCAAMLDDAGRQAEFSSKQVARRHLTSRSDSQLFSSVNIGMALPRRDFRNNDIVSGLFAGEGASVPSPFFVPGKIGGRTFQHNNGRCGCLHLS